jgi:hypothetical protein
MCEGRLLGPLAPADFSTREEVEEGVHARMKMSFSSMESREPGEISESQAESWDAIGEGPPSVEPGRAADSLGLRCAGF